MIINKTLISVDKNLDVYVEPWCDTVSIIKHRQYIIICESHTLGQLEIVINDCLIELYLWEGSTIKIISMPDQEVVYDSVIPVPPVP